MGGEDQLMLKIDGVPLIVRTCRRAAATGHPVFAAIPGPWHPRYEALRDEPVTCFDVPGHKEGIGGPMRGAVRRLPPCEAFMIVLADMPDLETADLQKVTTTFPHQAKNTVVRAFTDRDDPGHPILVSSDLRPEFSELSGDDGANLIVSNPNLNLIRVQLSKDREIHKVIRASRLLQNAQCRGAA